METKTNATKATEKATKAMIKAIKTHKEGLRKAVLEEVQNALSNIYKVTSSSGYKGATGCGLIVADEQGYSVQVKLITPKQNEKCYLTEEEVLQQEEPTEE